MTYRLFIDDDAGKPGMEPFRSPPPDDPYWKVARTSAEAIAIVEEFGTPKFISFDHDLGLLEDGTPDTVMTFLKWWADHDGDGVVRLIRDGEGFVIHSMNPVAVQNIRSYLDSWYNSTLYI